MINDGQTVPIETNIYYSSVSLAIYWGLGGVVLLYGLYLSVADDLFGYFLVILSLYLLYYAKKRSTIAEPVITINSKGAKTLNTSFISWENIEYIRTERKGSGKNANWYLRIKFKHSNSGEQGEDYIEISDLSVSPRKLEELISLYKKRHRANT